MLVAAARRDGGNLPDALMSLFFTFCGPLFGRGVLGGDEGLFCPSIATETARHGLVRRFQDGCVCCDLQAGAAGVLQLLFPPFIKAADSEMLIDVQLPS